MYVITHGGPVSRHWPSCMFLMVRPDDVVVPTFQDWTVEPLQGAIVTLEPDGCRHFPDTLLISRKVPFEPAE